MRKWSIKLKRVSPTHILLRGKYNICKFIPVASAIVNYRDSKRKDGEQYTNMTSQ